jgi:hypothetical protein
VSAPEAVQAYWREQLRQPENQRAVLTSYGLVITAAISGFIVQQHFGARALPLSVLIIIGRCGAVAAAKYHPPADYHLLQAPALTRVLVETGSLADHEAVLEEFRQQHYRTYPRLHCRRLDRLWTGLHPRGRGVRGCTGRLHLAGSLRPFTNRGRQARLLAFSTGGREGRLAGDGDRAR